jgi:hypothetical protein
MKHERLKNSSTLIDELKRSSLNAFEQGQYLQSGIILFQTVEILLRICVSAYGRSHGVAESVLKECVDNEISFRRLTLYCDLIFPKNGVGERLRKLNAKRNAFMHEAFYQAPSLEDLNKGLIESCKESVDLNAELRKLIGVE